MIGVQLSVFMADREINHDLRGRAQEISATLLLSLAA